MNFLVTQYINDHNDYSSVTFYNSTPSISLFINFHTCQNFFLYNNINKSCNKQNEKWIRMFQRAKEINT